MDWFWWVFILFMSGGFAKVADMARDALRTRHKRKMERLETARQERLELADAHKPPQPVCGCTHHLAKHDKQGKCHERVEVAVAWDADHKPTHYEAGQCTCQQYVGPQPLAQIYAEDLTDLA
ncbi:hypothetical protein FCH28_19480 [Streptomyces piniterrae]|uniref:Uncharacterized protein n=1 Tax=Streptomyces piniterrae TaxID=2571125 RepID=A0A4U0NPX5_9ACTN|nr:hypothetical protein [Streptomyces piniterrae]TJZ52204.1 hypothetical protein FCH28_19480 [Streptomyces piniterrae]